MTLPERSYTSGSGYRFGFNGKETDKEYGAGGGTQDYGFRMYSPAIGKFLSVDPLAPEYPWYTPYQFAGNKPIMAIDLDGLEEKEVIHEGYVGKDGTYIATSTSTDIYQNRTFDVNGRYVSMNGSFARTNVSYRVAGVEIASEVFLEQRDTDFGPTAAWDFTSDLNNNQAYQNHIKEATGRSNPLRVITNSKLIDWVSSAPDNLIQLQDFLFANDLVNLYISPKADVDDALISPNVSRNLYGKNSLPNKGSTRYKQLKNKLKAFRNKTGNKTVTGTVTDAEANFLGALWVGKNPKAITKKGKVVGLRNESGTRVYRMPSDKNSPYTQTGRQANFERYRIKKDGSKEKLSNAHIDM